MSDPDVSSLDARLRSIEDARPPTPAEMARWHREVAGYRMAAGFRIAETQRFDYEVAQLRPVRRAVSHGAEGCGDESHATQERDCIARGVGAPAPCYADPTTADRARFARVERLARAESLRARTEVNFALQALDRAITSSGQFPDRLVAALPHLGPFPLPGWDSEPASITRAPGTG